VTFASLARNRLTTNCSRLCRATCGDKSFTGQSRACDGREDAGACIRLLTQYLFTPACKYYRSSFFTGTASCGIVLSDLVNILEIQAHKKLVVSEEIDVGLVGLISGFNYGR